MIKINLLSERKQTKAKAAPSLKLEGSGAPQSALLVGIVLLGFVVAGVWGWLLHTRTKELEQKHRAADAELVRLEEVRKKGDEYKKRKELLARKIDLITNLKKRQEVPVHILDQVSKNLPDFLWLDSLVANNNAITITGKATTYNAVSNFYNNLTASGYFADVTLGRTSEAQDGVVFSLTCKFSPPDEAAPKAAANEG